PTDQEIHAWYDAHRGEYGQAGRVTFRHVFFDRARRGDDGARDAAEQAATQAAGHDVEIAQALRGDPFVMGTRLAAQGPNDLAKTFGPAFADQVLALPEGAWSAPVQSTYG